MLENAFSGGTGRLDMFSEENAARVKEEQAAPVTVIIGNPPHNVGQMSENDNNKNRIYERSRKRIKETYAKDSKATLTTKAYDLYAQFFRWATDRLGDRDGIIAYVSNNGFLTGIALDGMRKSFADEFTAVYHVNLGGNARTDGGGSVFGIRVGVGITFLVRRGAKGNAKIHYHAIDDALKGSEKLVAITQLGKPDAIAWQEITPDTRYNWLNDEVQSDYAAFAPMGVRRLSAGGGDTPIFHTYSLGVSTNRDEVVYDFRKARLENRVRQFIADYNAEVIRWQNAPLSPKERTTDAVDRFVDYSKIKWSEHLKGELRRGRQIEFDANKIRQTQYRPFCRQFLYFDETLNDRQSLQRSLFPNTKSEQENVAIVLSDRGHRALFSVLAVTLLPDLHALASLDGYQCFPLYTYSEDGAKRRENITDAALAAFCAHYADDGLTKRDIFHYIYALLHHPEYRARYRENLKRELPRIPLIAEFSIFRALADAGERLIPLHTGYETAPEYPLKDEFDPQATLAQTFHVEKMRMIDDGAAIRVNPYLTLRGIPPEAHVYKLGNRSALDWLIDQYRKRGDSDPNRPDEPDYIVRLIKRIVTVSVETVQIIASLPTLNFAPDSEAE